MSFFPCQSFGVVSGTNPSVTLRKKKKVFFICSIHSAINIFSLKNFTLKAKSPLLHPYFPVFSVGCFKSRNIIHLKNGIYVLDYFIPTTRFFIQREKIFMILFTPNFFLTFYPSSRKLEVFSPWKFTILFRLHFHDEILEIKNVKIKKKKDIVFILTKKNIILGWNLTKIQCVFNFKFDFFISIKSFRIINYSNKMALILSTRKIIIFDFFKKKYISNFEFEYLEKIKKICHLILLKEWVIFLGKEINLSYNKLHKTFIKWKFPGHEGKMNFGNFIKNTKIFLTTGLYDNTISLHKVSLQDGKFFLLNFKQGLFLPTQKIKKFSSSSYDIIISNKKEVINYCPKKRKFKKLEFGKIKKKDKLVISHLLVKNDFQGKYISLIILCFYKLGNPLIWNVSNKNFYQIFFCHVFRLKKLKNIYSLKIFPKKKNLIAGYEKNIICLFNFGKKKVSKFIFSHHFLEEKKTNCFIRTVDVDSNGNFFISGCSHGNLKLWKEQKMSVYKNLKFKHKILKSKWCLNSEMIFVMCENNKIYLVVPDKLCIKKIFSGHTGFVTGICLLSDSKTLVSTSMDKTLKTWNIYTSECLNTIFFDFAVVDLDTDISETLLITAHDYTIGVGFWKKFSIPFESKKKIFIKNEKNKKISKEENGLFGRKSELNFIKKTNSKTSQHYFSDDSFLLKIQKFLNLNYKKKKSEKIKFKKKKNLYNKKEITEENFLKIVISRKIILWEIYQNYCKNILNKNFFFYFNSRISFWFLMFLGEIFIEEISDNQKLAVVINFLELFVKKFKKTIDCVLKIGNLYDRIILETIRLNKRLENQDINF